MCNKLRFNDASFDVPDGTRGVDAGGSNSLGFDVVPVEGSERSAKLAGFAVVEEGNWFNGIFTDFPETEVVAGGGEEVGGGFMKGGIGGGMEHEFGGWVRVIEGK